MSELVGAGRGERRSDDRMTHRNGYRGREWQARAGTARERYEGSGSPTVKYGARWPRATWSPRRLMIIAHV